MRIIKLLPLLLFGIIQAQDGSLDTTFGSAGKVLTSVNPGADIAYGVTIQPDGKILVAGTTNNSTTGKDFLCLRYNTNGTLDTTFGNAGIFTSDLQFGSDDVVYSIALQSDGKIVLAGFSDDGSNKNAALMRLNSNGTIDNAFGTSGKTITDFITNRSDEIKVVKINPLSGTIVVGGKSGITNTSTSMIIARYTSTGILDTTFGNAGISTISNSSTIGAGTYSPVIEDLVIKSNGKITAVGWYEQQGLMWSADSYTCRLNSNGTFDTTYSNDGVNFFNGAYNGNDKAFSLILNSDDSFVMGGSSDISAQNYAFAVYGITSAGALATPLAQNQRTVSFGALDVSMNYDLKKDLYNKLICVGSTGTSSSKTFALSRINADFTVDTAFGTTGKVTTTFGNAINEAYDSAIQSDNKIIAVGYSGNDIAIARYNNTAFLSTAETATKNSGVNIYVDEENLVVESKNKIQDTSYAIYDFSGKLLLNGRLNSNKIYIGTLSMGSYIFVLNNLEIRKKFIKNK
ncbi:hypothetical protein [Chryseobacterium sp. sg2396]|uniref:hypothetical protein n=1 Tax=Chryseobacterium sp. sg2396 TaxID=3276280 RepID=UPI00366F13C5